MQDVDIMAWEENEGGISGERAKTDTKILSLL
jgi:hypothetical protein